MNTYDAEDLAIAVLGLHEYSDSDEIEAAVFKTFDVSMDAFTEIASALVPFTIPGVSPLTGDLFQGFIKDNVWLCKQKAQV